MKQNKLARIFENWVPKILSLLAAALLFYLYNVSKYDTRVLVIPLETIIPDALAPVNPLPGAVRITLKGESNVIYSIPESDISATVNLSSFSTPGTYRVPIAVEKKGIAMSANFLEYTIDPLDIEVQLDKKITKKVPVVPVFGSEIPENYEIINIQVQPAEVEIACPALLSDTILKLHTESITTSSQEGVYSYRAKLISPKSTVKIINNQNVMVLWEIKKIIVYKTFQDVPVTVQGLSDSLEINGDLATVTLKVSGLRYDIESLILESGSIKINLSDVIEPGVYSVAIETKLPPTIRVESILPSNITVRVIKKKVQ